MVSGRLTVQRGGARGQAAGTWRIDWPAMAACRNGDPDALFVEGAEQNAAKRICRNCPVRYECLADALDNRIEFGVWGGMTERERRALLRRHPQVASWRKTFEAALNSPVPVGTPARSADIADDRELVGTR
jgi:WhiB family redox-sensing transcriptional regulator